MEWQSVVDWYGLKGFATYNKDMEWGLLNNFRHREIAFFEIEDNVWA